ncbi:hypothetical protein [Brevibacterium renqingii]|uniref:hypothetical protein n=1 Tax=Brevibacterium renqingii TaxID=2776916 RepID=UPI001ADFE29D|nr:hypothetical protein [Brevibacterium renqingii]
MEFTSREIATVIITVSFVLLSFSLSENRKELLQSLLGVARAFAAWKVWTGVFAYLAVLGCAVLSAYFLGVWSIGLLKDTLIIGFLVGLPILFNSTDFKNGLQVVKHVMKKVLGVTALLILYINLRPLPLWGELVLQVSLLFLTLVTVIAKRDPNTASVGKFVGGLISFIVLGLIAYVTVHVFKHSTEFDWERELATFELSVWLPVSLIPFIYLFGLIASCEAALIRAKFHSDIEALPLPVRLGFLAGVHGSLRYATSFSGRWLPELATQSSFRQALRTMREYRRSIRSNTRGNRRRRRRLKENAGVTGVDEDGLWLDRREFHETKEALEQLFYSQMGLYRHRGSRYWVDPIVVFPSGGFANLPENHGVQLSVRDDGQAWGAWRHTPGNFYLGVGGTNDLDAHWRYAGEKEPASYPSPKSSEWVNISKGLEASPEWDADDSPLRPA